jgi:5-oxoprolinase (ATP-hydrolysing)
MPPNSTELIQEGAAIKSFKLVKGDIFDEKGITRLLVDIPASYKGCSGTRCLSDNISDLKGILYLNKAQVAANQRGINLIKSLIDEFSLPVVQAYMGFIRENAEIAIKNLLKSVYSKYGAILNAVDYMDNGSPICLKIVINGETGTALFDFEGTGEEVYGNINAPKSVTYSAIIYCLRCLVNLDMPLNQGALLPISIKIPSGCFLNPSEDAAVVGGNVLTSQRLCDVIFKAFRSCAASQGCCNNFTFGKGGENGFGYYETIAGGSGAGPHWNGRGGVHTHMTNTRITDPEILERRYPVVLKEFGMRIGSGGDGKYKGGDGLIREIEFLEPIEISMLSERRVMRPYGMEGGGDGKAGKNTLRKKIGLGMFRDINFGGKNSAIVNAGDRFKIETPGGGGWGTSEFSAPGNLSTPKISGNQNTKLAGGSLQNFIDIQNS